MSEFMMGLLEWVVAVVGIALFLLVVGMLVLLVIRLSDIYRWIELVPR